MADVVDLLHINDITVMRTLGPEDILADWKNMKLLARVLIDNELLDETEACLPLIYKGVGARPTARWELGSLQVPVDCPVFTLIITTAGRFQIFSFKVERGSDGMWDMGDLKYERICLRFRAQVLLCHPPSCFHRGGYTTPIGRVVPWAGIPPAKPWDKRIGSLDWILDFLPAERLILLGFQHYFQAQLLPRDSGHMKHAIATFERALENPNIDPGLSQVLETIIPFLYCLEQGYSSCLDVALQVLETFPGLLAEQRNVQVLLHTVVAGVVQHFEWHDHIPLAIKSIVGPLRLLHSTSPLPWTLFAVWVKLAYCHAPGAKEVLPLMDLVVEFHSSFSTSEGFESLPMMRAIVYFMQACKPGGPSLGMTLEAAEFVMHSLAAGEHSLHPVFYDWSTTWLVTAIGQNMIGPNLPYSDRLLSFIEWRSSNVPSPEDELVVMVFKSYLMGTPTRGSIIMTMGMSQATTLGDNDKRFIEKVRLDLTQQARGKEIFAEYPKGAAELVRNLIVDADAGLCRVDHLSCETAAMIARALRLPEAFKAYELCMARLGEERSGTFELASNALHNPNSTACLVIRDAISCASETGNYALALQWSDQGCAEIWNWLFHSRLSIGQLSATEPVVARALKIRPAWFDTWAQRQPGKPKHYDNLLDVYAKLPGYNLVPGLERFWRPKTPAEITSLADVLGGPIVYLNVNRYSSQALAVLPGLDDVVHIPLPHLDNIPMLHALSVDFMKSPQTFLQEGSLMERLWERKGFKVDTPGQTPIAPVVVPAVHFLAYLWWTVVKPVLDGLGVQHAKNATADMPRIWWCPSGPLIGLPIHAAGIYTDDGQGPVISDYVVSSYFPSASALSYATRPEDPSQKFSLLTIANPTGAGLPGTEWELEKIKAHTATQELTGGEATVEKVKEGMENTSWAHFACHGVINPDEHMESALILANHTRLTLREISDMSLPHAEFAYLSACQTAKGVVEALDQSAQLTTGMMACGYRSIIGTLWSIKDEYAPFVADRVYAKMLEGGRPDYKRAVYALHDAVQALRKEHNVPFATWLPFIHVGV